MYHQLGGGGGGGWGLRYLPPADEVWGKVMFLHLSIVHSVDGRVSLYDVTSCLSAWSHIPLGGGGVCAWSHVPSRGGLSNLRNIRIGTSHEELRHFFWTSDLIISQKNESQISKIYQMFKHISRDWIF